MRSPMLRLFEPAATASSPRPHDRADRRTIAIEPHDAGSVVAEWPDGAICRQRTRSAPSRSSRSRRRSRGVTMIAPRSPTSPALPATTDNRCAMRTSCPAVREAGLRQLRLRLQPHFRRERARRTQRRMIRHDQRMVLVLNRPARKRLDSAAELSLSTATAPSSLPCQPAARSLSSPRPPQTASDQPPADHSSSLPNTPPATAEPAALVRRHRWRRTRKEWRG